MGHTPQYISKLRGHRILIIGGTSGIGLCVAEAALEHGASVTVSGSTASKLHTALQHLSKIESPLQQTPHAGEPTVSGSICDLSNPSLQESALLSLLDTATVHGRHKLDHVVFTAGNNITISPLEHVTPHDFELMQTVRVLAPVLLAKLVPAYMSKSAHSSVTLTGGTQAMKPSPGWSVMAGIMSSISGFTLGFAVDLQPIRVNTVFPGAVHSTASNKMDPTLLEERLEAFRRTTLTNTVGTPEDVAEAYLYCMKSSYASGTTIIVDGGRLLKG
ncbi:hypothetical protein CB0940_12146 [Cercospora beticola]|uniref:Uncharacterized protein n=1 Tax=Cercospora beticola TaxID=122368 RepID=A0A2G5GIA4_CERBT|nr:hypothetical protein CB0940_12146 [Cercospora beticola]PIA80017.1 hypothetical protein CB0940_12146 [Cercospora beticola]WPB07646.1 hypothetical protein RHO25_012307 [Cercospora beticola]CAK1356550.1 unnamed protein product [Cercospora beticola]